MRILLVEDDKDLQRLLKKALTDAGYVVDQAFDGEEGHFLGDIRIARAGPSTRPSAADPRAPRPTRSPSPCACPRPRESPSAECLAVAS